MIHQPNSMLLNASVINYSVEEGQSVIIFPRLALGQKNKDGKPWVWVMKYHGRGIERLPQYGTLT